MPSPTFVSLEWICGFADRSCHLSVDKKMIEMASQNEDMIRLVFRSLRREDIAARCIRSGRNWVVRVSGREALSAWEEKIGFVDQKNAARLALALR